jgi:Spy/CpxP family protein refolding chaperone
MKCIRLFAIGTFLMLALTVAAKQSTTAGSAKGDLPSAKEQLLVLTQKLNLTGDQQAKIKPVLEQLHDVTLRLMEDNSLSHDERLAKVRPLRYDADKKIRAVLNEGQKKKLDEYEQGPHPDMHGSLSGKTQ